MKTMQRLLLVIALGLACSLPMPGNNLLKAEESTAGQIVLRGQTLDGQGKPVAGARVMLYQLDIDEQSDAVMEVRRIGEKVTGADGAFALTASRLSSNYRQGCLIARKEGLALGWATWSMQGEQRRDIILSEPRDLRGVVIDEAGRPVGDAEVSIAIGLIGSPRDECYVTSLADPELLTVRTDSDGHFVFANMPTEATFEFLVHKPGRARICTFDPSEANSAGKCRFAVGQADIKLVLPPEAKIEGRVVEKAGGRPVGGVEIIARLAHQEDPFGGKPVTSQADGTFTIDTLAAGEYVVRLIPKARETAEWLAEPVNTELTTGETVHDVTIALVKGGLAEIVIKEDAEGKPVEKVNLGIRSVATGQWVSALTDANGVARLRLLPGDYEIKNIYKQGYMRPEQMTEAFTIAEGETRKLEWTVAGFPSITGVVYDDGGKPLEGATVQMMPSGQGGEGVSDSEGQFKASWDPQGWSPETIFYAFARHPQRNLAAAQAVETTGGPVELKLRPAVTLSGQVADPNGKGIEGAKLWIMFHASNWGSTILASRGMKTDAQGNYELASVPADQPYSITAVADGYGQTEVRLEPAQVTGDRVQVDTCTLALANLSVSGVVVDPDGRSLANVRVSCSGGQDGQPDRRTQTDAEGKFTLDGVCAGQIRIQAQTRSRQNTLWGSVQTEGGAKGVQIVVTDRGSARPIPKIPVSLQGKPLPDLKKLGIELPADAEGKMLLVCFWDMNQRPSRYMIAQLAGRAAQLGEKGVAIVSVQVADVEQDALTEWVKAARIPFAVGRIAGDAEKTQFEWGVNSLPHLILTDKKRIVTADRFGLAEVEEKIEEASGR